MPAVAARRPKVTVTTHTSGLPHVRSTIRKMAELARAGSVQYEVRNLAVQITRDVPSKSPTREMFAIYLWVRDNIRYRKDPVGMEWVQAPWRTVLEGAGDCDDMATLIAALVGALGHEWRFDTVGPRPDEQAHVWCSAHDGVRWVSLDPVLEPTQPTTAARLDPGMFGASAVGASHRWSQEGTMLAGPRRRGGRVHVSAYERRFPRLGDVLSLEGLSGPTTAADRELWEWCPYYPQLAPTGGDQPPMPGDWTLPDNRYRPDGAPGYTDVGVPSGIVLAFRRGAFATRTNASGVAGPFVHDTLGAGFLKKLGRKLKHAAVAVPKLAHQVTHTGPIAKLEHAVQDVASKTVVLKPFVDFHKKVSSALTENVLHKVGVIDRPKHMPSARQVASSAASVAKSQAGQRVVPAGAARVRPVARAAAKRRHHAAAPSSAAWKAPHPELARKYPANARMLFDRASKVFRVFVPARGLSAQQIDHLRSRGGKSLQGVGAIVPTVTFTLGAAAPASVVDAARKAAQAVNTFKKNHAGKPPQIALEAVRAFQHADGKLTADGLYGSNTHAALSYYLRGENVSVPDHARTPKFDKPVTWQPPVTVAPPQPAVVVPSSHAEPKPVAVKPEVAKKPVDSDPVPAGHVEIGREKENPGLPPVGVDTHTGTAKGAPAGKGVVQPDWTMLPPDEAAILRAHAAPPYPGATFTTVPEWHRGDPLPSVQYGKGGGGGFGPNNPPTPGWQPAGTLPVTSSVPSLPSSPAAGPAFPVAPPPAPNAQPMFPVDDNGQPVGVPSGTVTLGPATGSFSPPSGTRKSIPAWLWLVGLYLLDEDQKRGRRAA